MAEKYILIMENEDKLRGIMEKIVCQEGYHILKMTDLGPGAPPALRVFDLAGVEKLHIQRVLYLTNGNKVEAARLLNIGLTTIYRKIHEYELE